METPGDIEIGDSAANYNNVDEIESGGRVRGKH